MTTNTKTPNDILAERLMEYFEVSKEIAQEQGIEVLSEENFDSHTREVYKRMGLPVFKIITAEVKRNWKKTWKKELKLGENRIKKGMYHSNVPINAQLQGLYEINENIGYILKEFKNVANIIFKYNLDEFGYDSIVKFVPDYKQGTNKLVKKQVDENSYYSILMCDDLDETDGYLEVSYNLIKNGLYYSVFAKQKDNSLYVMTSEDYWAKLRHFEI
ncbi:hypothetical protein BAU26_13830 [Bacillus sp. N35-10-4]|uniref:hypothetical protein n=1 Tax=Bacillus sp. N35-10-4 TaxID=1866315 RepID=UPI0008FE9B41|nr:hypothetical protein [Bacillus sp. N35-10-4]OJD63455.1 hypothetical protein BAU26_13830 [Bacillus sp. N35-10-4]